MAPVNYIKPKIELDDEQRFALMKFRRAVMDILQPHHDDYFLLRWLRARSWNLEAAEKMLRSSMKWRLQWEVDGALRTWKCAEVIEKYRPSGISGYDKEGAPVIVVPFAGLDIVGMLNSAPRQEVVKSVIQLLEEYLALAAETGINQVTVIFDMDDFSLRQYLWRPAAEVVIQLIQMYEANYPETLKACFIINAPRVFAVAFNIVKKFMDAYTISKIQIIKKDPRKWKEILLQHIDPDNLPKYFGGNLTDPDGNPKLCTKINQGGKVPESYYMKNLLNADPDSEKEYTTVTIRKGEKLTLKFDVEKNGSFLRWDFRTEDHDIRFGVTVTDASGKDSPAVRHQRVAAHQIDESGALACQAPSTYTVTFDNSYSMLRGKKLHYKVYITPPMKDLASVLENSKAPASDNKEEDEKKRITNENKNDSEYELAIEDVENIDDKISNSVVSPVH